MMPKYYSGVILHRRNVEMNYTIAVMPYCRNNAVMPYCRNNAAMPYCRIAELP
jgi:hypothetical protein